MNVDNIVASDYINIDARIEDTEMIDEEEIIAAVQEALEEEITSNSISNMDALNSIQNIFNYLQHNSDIKTNASVKFKESESLSKTAYLRNFL